MKVAPQLSGGLLSDVLGLELVFVNDEFRFRDPASGDVLPDYAEVKQAQREAEQRADAAEAELAALREQLRQDRTST